MKPLATLATSDCQTWCTSAHEDSPEPQVEPCLSNPAAAGESWAYLRHTPQDGTRLHPNLPASMTPAEWVAFRDAVDQLMTETES